MLQGFSYSFYLSLILGLYLTGLIWTIQWVHYPSFHFIGADKFRSFNEFHQAHMTHVVGPIMVIELLASLYLLKDHNGLLFYVLPAIVAVVWLSTFFVSVPLHTQLLDGGYSKELVDKLVLTNWPRTILWTLKSSIMFYIIYFQWSS